MTADRAVMLEDAETTAGGETDAQSDKVILTTRFGDMEFDRSQAIHMPRGLPGFAEKRLFGLANLPQPHTQQFNLMQCLDDAELSFLILPLDPAGGIVDPADLRNAANVINIAEEDLAVVVIVAIRDVGGQPEVSVNLRAPILLDTRNRVGAQHVLTNSNYPVRHIISGAVSAPAQQTEK